MGLTLIKPDRDDDFYVEWSSIVDAPTAFGTRRQMLNYLNEDGEERLTRTDKSGTSALWPDGNRYDDVARFLIYEQQGILRMNNLKELCVRIGENEGAAMSDLLEPFEDDL